MSLATRQALNSVHPYLGDRIRYILEYADNWSPHYHITSGLRTPEEQYRLFIEPNSLAAQVGCSQHQYGLAADVWFEDPSWQEWYLDSARRLGLVTVRGDPVHVQAVPGTNFRWMASSAGLCPDDRYRRLMQDPRPSTSQTQNLCGPTAVGSSCNHLTGCTCFY